jgi:SAM-dependent methyltransferase
VDSALIKRYMEFFSLGHQTIREDFDPYLLSYYRKLFAKPREADGFIRWCDRLAARCAACGGELLDAGCGFGLTCFGFAASSSAPRRIIGLDPSQGKISVMKKIADFLGIAADRIEPVIGDAMALNFPAAAFDAVFIKDVASHVRDRTLFFSEITRVLKPGGRMLLTDENNGLDILGRRARKKLWTRNEIGPLPPDSWMSATYRDERRRIIAECRPDLPADIVGDLAAKSMGMWGDELRNAAQNYSPGHEFINTADFPYRHPVSGEYMEYPFNPFRLAMELPSYGLDAKLIRPLFPTGHPLKKIAAAIIAASHPLSIIIQPSFYILVVKKS